MDEYVGKQALISHFDQAGVLPAFAKFLIERFPAAKVSEDQHGHWVWNPHHCKWVCSECGGMEGECEAPICKWCGARMDQKGEERA